MKKLIAFIAVATLTTPVFAVDEATAMAIAKKNNCLTCHEMKTKKVGPAWIEVGKKYGADPAAAEQLALKIKKGTKGGWGPIPMPPNPTVKDADIKTMVEFILTLK